MSEPLVEALALAGALLCSGVGMAWLALAMEVHWAQVRGAQPLHTSVRRMLRVLGATGLAVSLALCLSADTPAMAVLVWVMALAAGALLVALSLAWRPTALAPLVAWLRVAGRPPRNSG